MTVTNTNVANLSANSGATNNTTFVNCSLTFVDTNKFSGTIINSIIAHTGNLSKTINSTVLINTLIITSYYYSPYNNYIYLSVGSSSVSQNCYVVNNTSTAVPSLQENGYLGTDGTVVGIYGGDTPYDDNMLIAKVPKVTSSDLDLDLEQKKLNVTLTVSPQ